MSTTCLSSYLRKYIVVIMRSFSIANSVMYSPFLLVSLWNVNLPSSMPILALKSPTTSNGSWAGMELIAPFRLLKCSSSMTFLSATFDRMKGGVQEWGKNASIWKMSVGFYFVNLRRIRTFWWNKIKTASFVTSEKVRLKRTFYIGKEEEDWQSVVSLF